MAKLTMRVNGADVALLHRWSTRPPGAPRAPWPDRVCLDVTTAHRYPELARAARRGGVPVLVDPMTFLWQDQQWGGHPWLDMRYSQAAAYRPAQLIGERELLDRLVADCFDAQLEGGATDLVAPYVGTVRGDDGWIAVQVQLWEAVSRWQARSGLALPVAAVVAVGWRLLSRNTRPATQALLDTGLSRLGPSEVLLAASKVDDGTTAVDRLAELLSLVEQLSRRWPVTMWHQGTLGEACVVAGADGYETGFGWNERCHLQQTASNARHAPTGHPVPMKYLAALGQSVQANTLIAALTDPRIAAALTCLDEQCCPGGRAALGRDLREHTIRSRTARLAALHVDHPRWAWGTVAQAAGRSLALAQRINVLAARHGAHRVDVRALESVSIAASRRRVTAALRRPAA